MLNIRQNFSKRDPSKLTLRRALKAPAGHKFVSVDSSQIEARMLAYAAGELGLVEQFREGRDPYAELAEKIFGISAKEIHDGAKNGDKKLKNYRNVGKTCILSCFTPNTLVLTNHGWKQIACITLKDRVWDGDNYVQHKGVVCQGLRRVVDFFGTYCTEEHQFFNGAEWHTAKDYLDGDFDFDNVFEYGKKHVPSDAFLQYTIVLGDERDTRMTLQWPQIPGVEYSYSVETPVFDILHAGPQHRFMVLTENGPAIAHNCGYGVGSQKFSDTLLRQGVRLSDDLAKHHELAKQAHQIYRLSNRMIVAFWDECQRVIEAMESGAEGWFGGPDGKLFHYMQASLPGHEDKIPCIVVGGSEYKLWYPNLRWEKGEKRVEYFYDRVRGKNLIKTKTYGGSIAENITQSISFMLLGWQACRMNMAGVPLIANIHDAWLSCVPESNAEETMKLMEHWMSSVPSWLEGFPVACEGEIGDSYEIA
ncbi:DNA polymerase [Selenomonas ruminantium]|uniref:DNA polymerase n=1 Tax=Selenomonas ruminantium TaxID=971 RepID=UPI0026E9FF70|nr:DNA polymerase [Selenomonas ruminantium]